MHTVHSLPISFFIHALIIKATTSDQQTEQKTEIINKSKARDK